MKKVSVIAGVFLICILLSCSSFFKKDTYYGIQTSGKKIVFIVDISGSMEGANEGNISDKLRAAAIGQLGDSIGRKIGGKLGGALSSSVKSETTKLASAKRELKPAIMGLDESTSFTILVFSDKVTNWKDEVVSATDSTKGIGYAYISQLSSGGGTNALSAIKKAFAVKGVDTIFFLSDGQPSDASPDQILKEVEKINKKKRVTVHAIGLGDDKDEKFMKALAEDNGGKYIEG
ncbi:MAG TPA: VWA domain-containing protein [Spirochaetota bacterium]